MEEKQNVNNEISNLNNIKIKSTDIMYDNSSNNISDKDFEMQVLKQLRSNIKNSFFSNYYMDITQYDGRTLKILNYFYLNNEPLFYLAFSYCGK